MRNDRAATTMAHEPAVVLVAHGAEGMLGAGASLRLLAERLRRRSQLGRVEFAFIHGPPALAAVLDLLIAETSICVVPMFAAEGHHTRSIMPADIQAVVASRPWCAIQQAPALGVHPTYTQSLARRLRELVARAGVEPANADVLAIGHGSRRTSGLRDDAARRLADALRPEFASSQALYLDGEPSAASWPMHVQAPDLVVVPVFFSDARHASADVPRLFGRPGSMPALADVIDGPWLHAGRRLWYATMPPVSNCVADIVVELTYRDRRSRAAPRLPDIVAAGRDE